MADQGSDSKQRSGSAYADSLEPSGLRRSAAGEPVSGERPVTARLPAAGDVIDGKYRVDQLLAQGGMGAVFSASHVVSGKRVALKWMLPSLQSPDASERFIREARATARIDHPNVVDVYDVGQQGGSVYLVMEFLLGETLHTRMARSRVAPLHAAALLMPALRGVAAAHSHGVIHRDLKPDNIFLCQGAHGEPREPKVLDFGISKIANSEHARDHGLTQTGVVMGTPYYMSPEQVRGVKEVDERGDVYAFGVILYELLAGQRPFQAETYNQLILKIATEDPPAIAEINPEVPAELIALVARAMAREPEHRFVSIEDLALALEPFAAGATFHQVSSVPGELGAPRASRASASAAVVTPAATPVRAQALQAAATAPAPLKKRWLVAGLVLGLLVGGAVLWRMRGGEMAAQQPENIVKPAAAAVAALPAQTPQPAAADTPPTAAVEERAEALPTAQAPAEAAAAAAVAPAGQHRDRRKTTRAASAAPQQQPLAADWDERLPPSSTRKQPSSEAGPLSADDLR